MLKVHITGMFRSGTTLLCKMLDAHKNITCANDPYLPIFKAFRNSIEGHSDDPNRPLDDYYFDIKKNQLMTEIQSISFDVPVDNDLLQALQKDIQAYTADFSPTVAENILQLKGTTYKEVLSSAFDLVENCSDKTDLKVAAFKSAWTNEFTRHILDSEPDSKVIIITRDARAVAASKNALPDKYPWLFLARQWRKQAVFAWHAQQNPSWADRVFSVRYEDIISDPARFSEELCGFLGVDMDEDMLNAAGFKDAKGEAWTANSSHFENVKSFNTQGIDKWKKTLSQEEIEFIEYLCAPELGLLGYDLTGALDNKIPESILVQPPAVNFDSLANWIKPYEMSDESKISHEMSLEATRYAALYAEEVPDNDKLKRLFLDPDFYYQARKEIQTIGQEGSYA